VTLGNKTVTLTQQTIYPWDGLVELTVSPPRKMDFELNLRIPAWSSDPTLKVGGKTIDPIEMRRGYASIRRTWSPGDVVELTLPMRVERIQADPRVEADAGRVALQRGPLIYCLEAVDNNADLRNLSLPRDARLTAEHSADLLNGATIVRGKALAGASAPSESWDQPLYQRACDVRSVDFRAIPYYAWDNREPGAMIVWLPESLTLVPRPPISWVRASASQCGEHDTLQALHDRIEPANSGDQKIPRFTWWPRRGSTEWVQYDFDGPRTVASVELYWFDDSQQKGECRTPASWKLLHRDGQTWREVANASSYGVELDRYNRVTFEPVLTSGLRIEVQLQDKMSGGILEWKVGSAQ